MKKFLVAFIAFLLTASMCFAEQLNLEKETKYQKQLMQVGFRILNANQIDKRMTFYYSNNKSVNAYLMPSNKQIGVYKGLIPFIDNEDELAAILSHEIAHGLDAHAGYWRRWAMCARVNKYERKADKTGIDLMVNAGYNPVAMITVMNKIAAEPSFSDDFGMRSHPAGSQRLAYIYEYIYAKYPAYLVENDYQNNLYYQNFLLTSKKDRELIKKKYEEKYLKSVNFDKNQKKENKSDK